MRALVFFFALAFLSAQTVTIDVKSATATQAIIHVSAVNPDGSPVAGPCTYRVSEGPSFSASVNDVNPALFVGSNLDSRAGSIIDGKDRYFIAGTRLSGKAADRKYYSRALQTNTLHWAGVTCGTAPEQGKTFTTLNPTMGNSYPEFPAFDAGAFGNVAVPTIDWMDKTKTYIDPLTGVLIKRVTGPKDLLNTAGVRQVFTYARDLNGSWTNAVNALANQSSSVFATTVTPNAPLFLPWAPGTFNSAHASFDASPEPVDVRLRAFCSTSNGGMLQACMSLDSGQTCATDSIDISCPTSFGEVAVPSNYPAPMYSGWGIQSQPLSKNAVSTYNTPTVTVSGNKVTWVSENTRAIKFFANRAAGSKLQILGTSPSCAGNYCTVASYDSPDQITIQESVPSPVTASMQDIGAGIRVWLKNTGGSPSVNANFTYDYSTADQFFGGVNAEFDTCSGLPITDILTDAAGNPLSAPLSGYLCNIGEQGPADLMLWIPSTGEARLMSTYATGDGNRYYPPGNPFSASDSKSLFATDRVGNLWKGTLNSTAGVYREYVPVSGVNVPDNVTWTNLSATSTSVEQQLQALGVAATTAYASGLFTKPSFIGIVGGYALYDSKTSQDGRDGPCIRIRTLGDTNQIVDAVTSFDKYPMRWGACHAGPAGNGSLLNLTVNAAIAHDSTSNPLAGPWRLTITQVHRGGGWQSFSEAITAATSANVVQFTAPAHGMDPNYNASGFGSPALVGPMVTISGGAGAWTAANGTWIANVAIGDADHFTIPALNTSAFGAMTGSLRVSAAPPIIHSVAQSISQTTPAVVSIVVSVQNETLPQDHRLQDGDPIGFGSDASKSQYFAKVTGYSKTTFGVYSDTQLTVPVSGAALQNFTGSVYLAETCPANLDPQWVTGMPLDTGAVGARCISFRVAGEPCSLFANPGESAKYPCKSDPSNVTKSGLQDLQPGDAIRDLGRNGYTETMVLVKKVKNSETDLELTFMRWTPNKVGGGDDHLTYPYSSTHDFGWTPYLVPSNSHSPATAWLDANDPTHTFLSADPNYASQHGDFGHGNAPGLVTFAAGQGGPGETPDSIVNKNIRDLLATPLTYKKNEAPVWADSASTQLSYGYHIQTYPGHRQVGAPLQENVWKGDWNSMNPSFGGSQTDGGGLIGGITISNIRGTAYDSGSSTAHVYKISNVVGAFDRKRTPTYAWAGRFMFKDKSGPGSAISDADSWQYCVADNAGECRPGSAKNDVFLVAPIFYDAAGTCYTNTFNYMAPCFIGANPMGGWATQVQIDPIDSTGRRFRKLTQGLSAPGLQWTFTTWLQTPGGKWGFFSAPYVNGLRNDYFAMKLPPWPGSLQGQDANNRSNFIPISRRLPASPGSQYARARFGYAENGPPSSLFCSSRQEACSTEIPASAAGDPYSFVAEAGTHLQCISGCTVAIPAISGRIVYFMIDRLDGSGNITSTGPLEAVAVP